MAGKNFSKFDLKSEMLREIYAPMATEKLR